MESVLKRVYSSRALSRFLRIVSYSAVVISVLAYAALLFLSFRNSVYEGLAVFFSAAIPFFIVSFVRSLFDAPRPYELYDFYEERPKEREGKSFPSRHAYSSFAIAVLAYWYCVPLGAALSIFAIALCVSRVLLGIHFIRDVLAGGFIGIFSGACGIAVIGYIQNINY